MISPIVCIRKQTPFKVAEFMDQFAELPRIRCHDNDEFSCRRISLELRCRVLSIADILTQPSTKTPHSVATSTSHFVAIRELYADHLLWLSKLARSFNRLEVGYEFEGFCFILIFSILFPLNVFILFITLTNLPFPILANLLLTLYLSQIPKNNSLNLILKAITNKVISIYSKIVKQSISRLQISERCVRSLSGLELSGTPATWRAERAIVLHRRGDGVAQTVGRTSMTDHVETLRLSVGLDDASAFRADSVCHRFSPAKVRDSTPVIGWSVRRTLISYCFLAGVKSHCVNTIVTI